MVKRVQVIDYLLVLFRWRELIAVNLFAAIIISSIVSFLLPVIYRAETSIITFQEFDSQTSQGPIGFVNPASMAMEKLQLCITVLNSQTMARTIIQKYDLMSVYKTRNLDDAIIKFQNNLEVTMDDYGVIYISFQDVSPQRAAAVANSLVEELDRLTIDFSNNLAEATRKFIEELIATNRQMLANAEENLKNFQQTYGVSSLPEQLKEIVAVVADLETKAIVAGVKADILSELQTGGNPELFDAKLRLKEFSEIVRRIESSGGQYLFPSLKNLPEIESRHAHLEREVAIQESLYTFLKQEYEYAKYNEIKSLGTITVLDHAAPPKKHYKPMRLAIIFSSGLFSILLSLVIIIARENIMKLK